jgi:hypothetical protein
VLEDTGRLTSFALVNLPLAPVFSYVNIASCEGVYYRAGNID